MAVNLPLFPSVSTYMPGSTTNALVDRELLDCDALLRDLKLNLNATQSRMQVQHDRHRSERQFEVVYMVYLRLQPYRQATIAKRTNQKLAG
ncbi:hypothetical protein MRB53_031994 [Persea americana]|uniref:Uncharacterized protein n=1 Tax=Persea americana TaxID=3435 RepID=A0ACC2KR49_PERAE|nr:hypothetical protein MRB53_031994 [Persea americana]